MLLLIYYPSQTVARYVAALNLPRIAAKRDDGAQFSKAADTLGGQSLLLGLVMIAGFALVAPTAVTLLDGRAFAEAADVVALIGIMQVTRFLRAWPTTTALAMGRSHIVLANTVIRLISLPAGVLGVAVIGGLQGVTLGFAVGEGLALAGAILLLNWASGNRLLHDFDRLAIFAAGGGAVLAWVRLVANPTPLGTALTIGGTAALLAWIAVRERETLAEAGRAALRVASAVTARSAA